MKMSLNDQKSSFILPAPYFLLLPLLLLLLANHMLHGVYKADGAYGLEQHELRFT